MALNDFEELRTFSLVVDSGGFSAAARLLGVSTNAVSRRIMSLEASLGTKLLNRSTRAVVATAEGRKLHAHARRILDELTAAEADITVAREELKGSIRFAIPGSACSIGVLRGVTQLLDDHPNLDLQIRIVNQRVDVIGGAYDVALHIGPPKDSRLISRKLFVSSGWALAAAPAYAGTHRLPKIPSDLKEHNCLRFAWRKKVQEWRLIDSKGRMTAVEVSGNFEADDSRVLSDATYAGLGIGLRPANEIAGAVQRGELVKVLPEYRFAAIDVYAIMPKGASKIARVARFLDAFSDALSKEV